MRRPTRIVVILDEPLSWADARSLGDAVDVVLGGRAKVKLDRDGRRWTFTATGERVSDGTHGVRDPDAPCEDYTPGEPTSWARCEGDGHYLCKGCSFRVHEDLTR